MPSLAISFRLELCAGVVVAIALGMGIASCGATAVGEESAPACECSGGCPSSLVEDDRGLPALAERPIRPAVRVAQRSPKKGGPSFEGVARPLPAREPWHVFFGNLHSHTGFSDGTGTPEEAYTHARDVAKLDFLLISEHNHKEAATPSTGVAFHHDRYEGPRQDGLIPVATRLTNDGVFVALYGQEFSTISAGNHVNVFDVPHVIDEALVPNGSFDKLLDTWLPAHLDSGGQQAILQLNHPWNDDSPNAKEYGRDDFTDFAEWRRELDARARLIEIINGPAKSDGSGVPPETISDSEYRRYLNLGFHLAPAANQDNHKRTWGSITDARTAVVATSLTKVAVLGALRERHAYATLDKNLRIIATVEGQLCGEVLAAATPNAAELGIEVTIADDDESSGRYWVEVFVDKIDGPTGDTRAAHDATYGPIVTAPGVPELWSLPGLSYEGWDYLYLRVLRGSESAPKKLAWLAPVWFR